MLPANPIRTITASGSITPPTSLKDPSCWNLLCSEAYAQALSCFCSSLSWPDLFSRPANPWTVCNSVAQSDSSGKRVIISLLYFCISVSTAPVSSSLYAVSWLCHKPFSWLACQPRNFKRILVIDSESFNWIACFFLSFCLGSLLFLWCLYHSLILYTLKKSRFPLYILGIINVRAWGEEDFCTSLVAFSFGEASVDVVWI